MNITIVGRKCTPRESFKDRAALKLHKVEKFFGPDATAKVTATVEKNVKIVEITLQKGGFIFRAQERAQDLEEALDNCVDSLIRQIRKIKPNWSAACAKFRLTKCSTRLTRPTKKPNTTSSAPKR